MCDCSECDTLGLPIGAKGDSGSIIGAVARISIPSAQVLAAFTTPIQLLGAPGVGTAIKILGFSSAIQYGGVAYATNTTYQIYTETATKIQGSDSFLLTSTVSRNIAGNLSYVSNNTDTQIIANQPIMFSIQGGNPTLGNSDIIIYLDYEVITL